MSEEEVAYCFDCVMLQAEIDALREDAAKVNEEELAQRLLGYMERFTAAVEATAINTAPSELSLTDILLKMGEQK